MQLDPDAYTIELARGGDILTVKRSLLNRALSATTALAAGARPRCWTGWRSRTGSRSPSTLRALKRWLHEQSWCPGMQLRCPRTPSSYWQQHALAVCMVATTPVKEKQEQEKQQDEPLQQQETLWWC